MSLSWVQNPEQEMNKLEKERRRVLEEDILQRQWFIQSWNCGRIRRLCAVQSLKDDPCAGKGRKGDEGDELGGVSHAFQSKEPFGYGFRPVGHWKSEEV